MRCAILLALLLLAAPLAGAVPSVQVAPISLELANGRAITSLRLRNLSSEPLAFSGVASTWTQENGEDRLTPTTAIIISPPAFVIQPGVDQVVRIGMPGAAGGASEEAYRLVFTQTPLRLGDKSAALNVRLQLSLPLFVEPRERSGPASPQIVYGLVRGARVVRIVNPSNRHMVLTATGAASGARRFPRYLLAGQSFQRPVADREPLRMSYVLSPDSRN